MWVSYPIEATYENWLHEALVTMIRTIHDKLDMGQPVPKWKYLIPTTLDADKVVKLRALTGIKDRLSKYEDEVKNNLSPANRNAVIQMLENSNNIVCLLNNTIPILNFKESFPNLFIIVKDLFVFAYKKLTDIGIRDRQYRIIFDKIYTNICPFCGFERIMSPQETRQDQDHYLAKSIYPFAAANMRNLAPMCRCCNRDYKHGIDILHHTNGTRRKAYDPYAAPGVDICLKRSLPFEGLNNKLPAWWVDILPDQEESETWDQTFCIRMRYSRDVLNTGFNRWISSFQKRCQKCNYPTAMSDLEVLDILKDYHQDTILEEPVGIDFLKPKVFDMLIHHFQSGNNRVIQFVRDAVVGIQIAA